MLPTGTNNVRGISTDPDGLERTHELAIAQPGVSVRLIFVRVQKAAEQIISLLLFLGFLAGVNHFLHVFL